MVGDGTRVRVASIPDCDIHKRLLDGSEVPATVDGKTIHGPWGFMCDECHEAYGMGLGIGRGQRLILADEMDPEPGVPL